MNRFWIVIVLLLLTACTGTRPQAVKFDPRVILDQLEQLPGVQLNSTEPLQFSYPGQTLFGTGAVLPLPGGTTVLDPLATFFQRNPGLEWRVDVQAQTSYGSAYDQHLAEKRSELLATYLLNKGVALQGLTFHPEAAAGQPLIFTLTQPHNAVKK